MQHHKKHTDLTEKVNFRDITTVPNWRFDVVKVIFFLLNQSEFYDVTCEIEDFFRTKKSQTTRKENLTMKKFSRIFFRKKDLSKNIFAKTTKFRQKHIREIDNCEDFPKIFAKND